MQTDIYERAGHAGERLIYKIHEDIDWSIINVDVNSGSVEVLVDEKVWWTWKIIIDNEVVTTTATYEVWVDSTDFDGDHRLQVKALADGTDIRVMFQSDDD